MDSVPTDTDEACAEWLHAHFREKVSDDRVIVLATNSQTILRQFSYL